MFLRDGQTLVNVDSIVNVKLALTGNMCVKTLKTVLKIYGGGLTNVRGGSTFLRDGEKLVTLELITLTFRSLS